MERGGETTLDHFGTGITPIRNGYAVPVPIAADPVRHGSKLSYDELKEEAHRLARESPRTYGEIAEGLDVSENAVAKAVTTAGPKFQRLQMRIVELLSEYEVERREHVEFRTWRKDRDPDG